MPRRPRHLDQIDDWATLLHHIRRTHPDGFQIADWRTIITTAPHRPSEADDVIEHGYTTALLHRVAHVPFRDVMLARTLTDRTRFEVLDQAEITDDPTWPERLAELRARCGNPATISQVTRATGEPVDRTRGIFRLVTDAPLAGEPTVRIGRARWWEVGTEPRWWLGQEPSEADRGESAARGSADDWAPFFAAWADRFEAAPATVREALDVPGLLEVVPAEVRARPDGDVVHGVGCELARLAVAGERVSVAGRTRSKVALYVVAA